MIMDMQWWNKCELMGGCEAWRSAVMEKQRLQINSLSLKPLETLWFLQECDDAQLLHFHSMPLVPSLPVSFNQSAIIIPSNSTGSYLNTATYESSTCDTFRRSSVAPNPPKTSYQGQAEKILSTWLIGRKRDKKTDDILGNDFFWV